MSRIGFYTGKITIDDVRKAAPSTIYYSAQTCWWTHDPAHLCKCPDSGLPCDPRGGVLFQTNDIETFLQSAEKNNEHYGVHGIKAFEAAHHLNTVVSSIDGRSTCFQSWDDYNQILDTCFCTVQMKGTDDVCV